MSVPARPPRRSDNVPARGGRATWMTNWLGLICLLIGLIDIAGAIVPRFRHSRLREFADVLPGTVSSVATAAALVVGILLVMLAHGLRRRKRRAWRAAVALLAVSVLIDLVRWHALGTAVISVAFLTALAAQQDEFYALSDPRTRRRALWNLLVMGAVSIGLGLIIVSAHRDIAGDPSFSERLRHVLLGLVGVTGPVAYTQAHTGDIVAFSLGALGVTTALTTTYLFLRPDKPVTTLDPADEGRLRQLLAENGARDSIGYFALRRDKSVIFSPTGKAAIAYRVVNGVMLAGGDPIGDPEAWPGAIEAFLDTARRHAWVPAVMGCGEQGGTVWARVSGLSALEIGDEAIVDATAFSLSGRQMRNVRQMVARVSRAGYSCRVRRVAELDEAERDQLVRLAVQWRTADAERGFSMQLGRLADPSDDAATLVTAHDETGEPRAFLHFVPWGTEGISLDIMRRDRSADPGLNELMVVAAIEAGPRLGYRYVSLNFAAFRAALARGERLGAGPVLRMWRSILILSSRWIQIESLYRFNAKFRPDWQPRFLLFPATRDLPRIGLATLRVEGLLSFGRPRLRLPRVSGRNGREAASPAPSEARSL